MNKNVKLIVSIATITILFVVASVYFKNQEAKKLGFMANENYKLFVPDYAVRMGPDDAKVSLVEFLDPECESCRAFSPYVKEIMKKYDGKVQLVVRYAAYHKNSAYAISILEAVRKQGKYWETLNKLFENQPVWGNHHNPRPDLIWTFLPGLGLDVERIKKDMHDPEIRKIIQQDSIDGKKLGVRGTPSFFINGQPLKSFGFRQLEDQIKSELDK